jgi:hypothetical protein
MISISAALDMAGTLSGQLPQPSDTMATPSDTMAIISFYTVPVLSGN